ncbi:hypothetical protein C0R05_06110 [Streptomyces albidoflavus]|nr:hypothetical protein C0R05_06110 [Streptomyces albidoflavus]
MVPTLWWAGRRGHWSTYDYRHRTFRTDLDTGAVQLAVVADTADHTKALTCAGGARLWCGSEGGDGAGERGVPAPCSRDVEVSRRSGLRGHRGDFAFLGQFHIAQECRFEAEGVVGRRQRPSRTAPIRCPTRPP